MEEGGGKWWGHEVECLELQFLEEGMEIRDRDCSRERAVGKGQKKMFQPQV